MIRQAISCDVCGGEKRQTNHWFVATEHAGELRISGWSSRNRLRPGSRHLCGQTCLHKLLDEFVARSVSGEHAQPAEAAAPKTDASLTAAPPVSRAPAAFRPTAADHAAADMNPLAVRPMPVALTKPVIVSPVVVPLPMRTVDPMPVPIYTPRHSRAEAWERERERAQGRGPRKCF